MVGRTRRRLAVELIGEIEAMDRKTKAVKKELTELVTARGSTLLKVPGIGPSGAARLLADVGDVHRFADRDRFASWNGTAPLDASSGEQNGTGSPAPGTGASTASCTSWPSSNCATPPGRAYYDHRKAGGMPSMMAMRALKRRLSNVIYARMIEDQKRRPIKRARVGTRGRLCTPARPT